MSTLKTSHKLALSLLAATLLAACDALGARMFYLNKIKKTTTYHPLSCTRDSIKW